MNVFRLIRDAVARIRLIEREPLTSVCCIYVKRQVIQSVGPLTLGLYDINPPEPPDCVILQQSACYSNAHVDHGTAGWCLQEISPAELEDWEPPESDYPTACLVALTGPCGDVLFQRLFDEEAAYTTEPEVEDDLEWLAFNPRQQTLKPRLTLVVGRNEIVV